MSDAAEIPNGCTDSDKLRKCDRQPTCVIKYSVAEQATSKRRGLIPGIFTRNPFLPSKQSLSLWKRKNELVELVFGKTELAGELLGKRRLGRAGSELGLDALV